ncbi:MAG TPA: DUF1858 domain-containing protein [candidate division Zixibacteria bacterium]|nr:DUF1858 domain-containing protein [candidate division Zixibacteria bacterium]
MITSDDSVEDLLEKYPGATRFLMKRGIICVQCGEAYWGKLGDLIDEKGLDKEKIIAELNAEFSKE